MSKKVLPRPVLNDVTQLNNDGDLCKIVKDLRLIDDGSVGMGSFLSPIASSHLARLKTLYEFSDLVTSEMTEAEMFFLWCKLLFKNICILRNSVDGYKSELIKDMVGNFNKNNIDSESNVSDHERLDVDS